MMNSLNVVMRDQPENVATLDLWNAPAWQRFGHVRSVALAGEQFTGRLEQGDIGFLSVCRVTSTGHRVEHEAETLSPGQAAYFKLLIQLHGSCRFQRGSDTVELGPGDFVLYENGAAYSLLNPQAVEQIVVSIPEARVRIAKSMPSKFLGQRLSAQSGGGRLAVGLLRAALDELAPCSPQAEGHIADAICQLVCDVVREQIGEQKSVPLGLVLRARVRDYIENNLSDPDLSVEQIAARLNCSRRYLYEVFDDAGMTIGRYMWKRRLERCKDELVDVDRAGRPLSEIAFAWGFSSLSHFSKAFKREFGAAPSAFRAR